MGKKKKSGGGGRRSKGRTAKDHHSGSNMDYDIDILNEEITALCAIFQDDCKVVSDAMPQLAIKLRPYSKDTGYEDIDVSAILSVRFLPGYPFKCPKLQITPEKGLCAEETDNLLSLLHDQANSNAREGRVMIYNLVETAQEFLSEIVPVSPLHENVSRVISGGGSQSFQEDMKISSNETFPPNGPFIYGFIDLFAGLGESWNWGIQMDEDIGVLSSAHSHRVDNLETESPIQQKKIDEDERSPTIQDSKHSLSLTPKLHSLEEEFEDETRSVSSTDASTSLVDDAEENNSDGEKEELSSADCISGNGDSEVEGEFLETSSIASSIHAHPSQNLERDLVMVHLLRLACASKGTMADTLPVISTELYNLGILSDWVLDLATKPSSIFKKAFDRVFHQHRMSSRVSQFWIPSAEAEGRSTLLQSSRYTNDFDELRPLGHGGFGHVVLCKNKIDGRQYAVKKIRLRDKTPSDRILREVATLSRLQHHHVVRYYQAWFETGVASIDADSTWDSKTAAGSSFSNRITSSADLIGHSDQLESTYLYIQMEYCPRTLRQVFESYNHFDKESAWHLFHQIVEGLSHIHAHGIIHRDLTPNNIFFDARNDIKIGDFGLAKFLKLEQLDQDPGFLTDMPGVSVDGTGQIGTYFYTAPEIEQRWPKIDEKADMYSLGVVFFELWHPFGTAMERHVILSDLKQKCEIPSQWVAEFPEQASLLQRMMSPSPSDRPSATELLQHAFPPRMEHELVDNILRTMRTSEDSSIYDRVVNTIFNNELLSMRDRNQRVGKQHSFANETLSIRCTDSDTDHRDHVIEVAREEFKQHCAKHLEIVPMHLLDDNLQFNRNTVKLLTHGGDMIELCHELRLPFVNWVIRNQKTSLKRYDISYVHRRAVGHSAPNRYLQGDFDIIGGASALTEAEVIKVTMDTVSHFFHSDVCDIHLNHGDLLDAIWSWIGIKPDHRHKVAELLSLMGSLRPQSSERKSKWVLIRRQLQQELGLGEAVVNRLQTVGLRFCGPADQALPRLRGALPSDKLTRKALHELSELCSYLRVWKIEKRVFIDAFMTPTEIYHRDLFFQIYLIKESSSGSLTEGVLLAVGGRYDFLLHQLGDYENKSNAPGGVGSSLALETVIQHSSMEIKPSRSEASISVLVCSRGGGGVLEDRMDLTAELWGKNIKAQFVPMHDPSLTQQYEYANEHDIKCLIIIDAGISQTGFLKVRHLELKKEKEVERGNLVKFLLEATVSQFRNPSIWN